MATLTVLGAATVFKVWRTSWGN